MSLQVILGFDASASMLTQEEDGTTRLNKAKELAGPVINKACQIDENGPDVYSFGQVVTYFGNVTADQAVEKLGELQAKEYATNLGAFLIEAFGKSREYISQGDEALVLIFTDGAASDRNLVESEIIKASNSIEKDSQLALEIVYIGSEAEEYLKELDDKLQEKGAKFDIVDATPIGEAISLDVEKLLYKAFND